ncbi:MAG: HNH endonuclease [Marinobacter adhaerens]
MSSWDDDILKAFENLGGSASYDSLYAEIERIRSNLPSSWKSVVRRRIQDLSSDSAGFKGGRDLFFSVEGLGAGVWGLRSYLGETPKASDLPEGVEEPGRAYALTYRVLRDTVLARKIKVLHQDRCQICGAAVQLTDGKTYSEAHHIIPLGKPHNGSDKPGNVIVLCPNHHVLCDYGAIKLDYEELRTVNGHEISKESIKYHNDIILGRPL